MILPRLQKPEIVATTDAFAQRGAASEWMERRWLRMLPGFQISQQSRVVGSGAATNAPARFYRVRLVPRGVLIGGDWGLHPGFRERPPVVLDSDD
jgi:hypothetical protein